MQINAPQTVTVIEHLRAWQRNYEAALQRIETLSDTDLARCLAAVASDSTLARLAAVASDDTLARLAAVHLCVPIIPSLDARIADAIGADGARLDMSSWHCGTTHCRAGWAITLGGEAGARLEEAFGSEMAGRLIYEASTGRPAPDFYATTAKALADIRRCAAEAA